jgi:hypothetical protein
VTTLNQLLKLIEMSGMQGDDEVALRVGEAIAPMESCTFHEMNGRTALMFQGGRKQPSQETRPVPDDRWIQHGEECGSPNRAKTFNNTRNDK